MVDPVDARREGGFASFTLDDFPVSALTVGGALLEAHGYRGTYYASMGLTGKDTDSGRAFDRDDLRRCNANGHEVAQHTFAHVHCTELTAEAILADRAKNAAALAPIEARNFAYPFGDVNGSVKALLRQHFTSCRGIRDGINGRRTDLGDLKANRIYSRLGVGKLMPLIKRAAQTDGWVIFYTHDVAPVPSPYGCTPDALRQVIDAVGEAGLAVGTVSDGLAGLLPA
jgi:peptidoglycan/xylan/chitin deacetylase (PgdA/CDA1 family)